MGFYLRTSLKAGPFRFNLLSPGIGVSVGVAGFRVGIGRRGNYVRVASLGTTYFGGQAPGKAPARATRNDGVVMQELAGVPVQQLVAAHPSDLISQPHVAAQRRRLWPWIASVIAVLALVTFPFGLILLVPGVPVIWWCRQRDLARRSVVVFYQVEDILAAEYERLTASNDSVSQVQRVWHVEAEGALHTPCQRKVNAEVGVLIRRTVGTLNLSGPPVLVTNIAVPSLHGKERSVYFLPDRVIVRHGKQYADLLYAAVGTNVKSQRFIESVTPPADSQRAGTRWQFTNKSGGPDRRFKNNRQLPIMLYGRLTLTTPQGSLMVWHFPRPDVAASLADTPQRMRQQPPTGRA